MPFPTRFVAAACATAAVLAAAGFALELARFGRNDRTAASALETEVRRRFAERARQVTSLAERVARDPETITRAAGDRDTTPRLFDRLTSLARATDSVNISATLYLPAGPLHEYRASAWSEGPAEDVPANRLSGPRSIFVAVGTSGLRLVFVTPVETHGRRTAVAAAETVLSPGTRVGTTPPGYPFETSYGPVALQPPPWAGEGPQNGTSFLITTADGGRLVEVRYDPTLLDARRSSLRHRTIALAALPLITIGLLLTGRLVARRQPLRSTSAFLGWSILATGGVVLAALALAALARLVGLPAVVTQTIVALTALGLVALVPVSWWWRPRRRRVVASAPVRFALEQLAAGVVLGAVLLLVSVFLKARINAASLDKWQFPVFPLEAGSVFFLAGLLLTQIACCWAATATLAVALDRWRLDGRRPLAFFVACALWFVPTVVVLVVPHELQPLSRYGIVVAAAVTIAFALAARALRRVYRHTTQALRLALGFAALFLPSLVFYPMAADYANRTARDLVQREYAPATANHPQDLRAQLNRAQGEIDHIPNLAQLAAKAPPAADRLPTQAAFEVWRQTSLSRALLTSEIELFGPDRTLVSRFALNVPEYRYPTGMDTWQGKSCAWDVFGEAGRFGSEERPMLHAERGICDADRQLIGAVVIHVVPDYQSLPFIATANPYAEVLGAGDPTPRGSRLSGLQLVVYGWSFHPLFAPGGFAWPVTDELFARLYRSRDPFWTTLAAKDRAFQVHFTSDRSQIYALGYPTPTPFEHVTRVTEAAALTAVLFVVLLVGAAFYAPFARRAHAPLALLIREIRASFYRKLFLVLVFAAVGPVLLLSLAFGAYMTGKFRADVESEAAAVVKVAQRVYQELSAATARPGQPRAMPTDDVMVWIRQVIGEDVNVYDGSRLVATSQRALFESGLLPTRTPAAAYRALALDRLPTVVVEDRLGTFRYLVAAARVPAFDRDRDRDVLMSVPLALRQREIEREIDQLNRGVLVGAVIVVLFAAGLGASVAGRVSDPVARLTRATRQIAAGRLDVRLVADAADELGRLVEDFNSMAETLVAQRAELARTNQLKAWAEMSRQVAHEIKNPLTPIQLAAEHLQRVHEDEGRPLGDVFDTCVSTVLRQVRLLRQIASEFSNFAAGPTPRLAPSSLAEIVADVIEPYRAGLRPHMRIDIDVPAGTPRVHVDRTLVARAITNVVENALQAMPEGGTLRIKAESNDSAVTLTVADSGVGMDAEAARRAFEPYYSTKTAGSGLGLANAKRYVELCGGSMTLASAPGHGTTITVTLPVAPRPGAAAS